jgi:hypothetical protein
VTFSSSSEVPSASFTDYAFAALEGPRQPMDCALVLELSVELAPSLELLREGAEKAFRRFPRSRMCLGPWGWRDAPSSFELVEYVCASEEEAHRWTQEFVQRRFALAAATSVAQARLVLPSSVRLVLRMHHAVGDLLSAVSWLSTQLGHSVSEDGPLVLRKAPKHTRLSRFAWGHPSDLIRTPLSQENQGKRSWRSISFDKPPPFRLSVAERSRSPAHIPLEPPNPRSEFTYNDALAAIALETLARWNKDRTKVALWLPVNVRADPFKGFGNGSSRIRVYRHPDRFKSFRDAALSLREQVKWSRENGEWYLPSAVQALARIPGAAAALARRLANRKNVDMATAPFSHAERLVPDGEAFPHARRLEIVAQQYQAHPMAMNAATLQGKTWMTFTWDTGRFSTEDANAFIALFEQTREEALKEWAHG